MRRQSTNRLFKNPYASLDPRLPIGETIAEGLPHTQHWQQPGTDRMVLNALPMFGLEDSCHPLPHESPSGSVNASALPER